MKFNDLLINLSHNGCRVVVQGSDPELPNLAQRLRDCGYQVYDDFPYQSAYDNSFIDQVILLEPAQGGMPVSEHVVLHTSYGMPKGFNNRCTYFWHEDKWQSHIADSYSTPASQSELDYFKSILIDCVPQLDKFASTIGLIYWGATEMHAGYKRNTQEAVAEVRALIGEGFTNIVFWCAEENLAMGDLAMAQRVIDSISDPDINFIYATSGLDAEKIYNKFCTQYQFNRQFLMLAFYRFAHVVLNSLRQGLKENMFAHELLKPYDTSERKHYYINFNRMPRLHRIILTAHLLENNLFYPAGHNSFDFDNTDITNLCLWLEEIGQSAIIPAVKQLVDICPLVLNRTEQRENPVDVTLEDMLLYYNTSYFSVVSETDYFSSLGHDVSLDCKFFSEKVFKPFMCKHPFVLVARYNSLPYLTAKGYQTFHPWIDETYDTIEDDHERMLAVVAEIKRLCNLSRAEWQEIQENIAPRLEHNFNQIKETRDTCYTQSVLTALNNSTQ